MQNNQIKFTGHIDPACVNAQEWWNETIHNGCNYWCYRSLIYGNPIEGDKILVAVKTSRGKEIIGIVECISKDYQENRETKTKDYYLDDRMSRNEEGKQIWIRVIKDLSNNPIQVNRTRPNDPYQWICKDIPHPNPEVGKKCFRRQATFKPIDHYKTLVLLNDDLMLIENVHTIN